MEKKNFEFAGKALSEVWSELVIDQFPTVAEYLDPDGQTELDPGDLLSRKSEDWFASHVRTSQYFTQIVKFANPDCCSPGRSSYFSVIPCRFLPPPIPLCQTGDGLRATDVSDPEKQKFPSLFVLMAATVHDFLPRAAKAFKIIPYDMFCPSVQSSLQDRICKHCNLYFSSQVMLKKHVTIHANVTRVSVVPKRVRPTRIAAKRQRELMAIIAEQENTAYAEWFDEEELETTGLHIPEDERNDDPGYSIPIVSIAEHMKNPWEEE